MEIVLGFEQLLQALAPTMTVPTFIVLSPSLPAGCLPRGGP